MFFVPLKGRFPTTFQHRVTYIIVPAAIVAATLWVLARQCRDVSFGQVTAAALSIDPWRVALSAILTAFSFGTLATYDVIAAHLIAPGRVPTVIAAFAGVCGNAISNTLGFHALTGSAVRYRIYSRCGLTVSETARIISLSWAALGLGFLTMVTLALLLESPGRQRPSDLELSRASGLVVAFALAVFLLWLSRRVRIITLGRVSLTLPSARFAAFQMGIGAVETAATIGALYLLLPQELAPPFAAFALAFIGSVMLGIISNAPGGVGVFEVAMLSMFPSGSAAVLSGLFLFRLIYNISPFLISLLALGIFELTRAQDPVSSTADSAE